MKNFIEYIIALGWFVNLVYAWIYWGFSHGFLNLFIPYAIIADILKSVGRF